MLRKLSTFSIALFGLLAPSLTIAGQDASPWNHAPAVAADDKSPAPQA